MTTCVGRMLSLPAQLSLLVTLREGGREWGRERGRERGRGWVSERASALRSHDWEMAIRRVFRFALVWAVVVHESGCEMVRGSHERGARQPGAWCLGLRSSRAPRLDDTKAQSGLSDAFWVCGGCTGGQV